MPHLTDLPDLLAESYAVHPMFRSDMPTFRVEDARVDRFCRAYTIAIDRSEPLSSWQFRRTAAECRQALRAIFDELAGQAPDGRARLFVAELFAECERILDVNFDFARQSTRRRFGFQPGAAPLVSSLDRDRFFFGRLSDEVAQRIARLAVDSVTVFRGRAAAGKLTRDDLSANQGSVVRAIAAALNEEFGRQGVLDAVSAYTRRPMMVSGLALELTVPQATWWRNAFKGLPGPPATVYAHLDESSAHPKAIVYVTDVGDDDGPTSCYPHVFESLRLNPLQDLLSRVVGYVGNAPDSPLRDYYAKPYHQSMCSDTFRQHYLLLPQSLRFNSHFGWDVLPGSAAERTLVAAERKMLGPSGTFIVFDGARLLHRGGLSSRGERVALQVIFSDARLTRRIASRLRRRA